MDLKLHEDFERFSADWEDTVEYNTFLYNYFIDQVNNNEVLLNHFQIVSKHNLGYGEMPFRYLWLLIFNQLPEKSKFLEIGVFRGSILALSQLCSSFLKKTIECYGVTPLSSIGDKYSVYDNDDYDKSITFLYNQLGLNRNNTNIIKGISTDEIVKKEVLDNGPYDIVYIDGGHDYETVINDIELSDSVLKNGGLLVMDDASSHLKFTSHHGGFKGHDDVARAIEDNLDKKLNYRHLFACGHNRVWKKNLNF